MKKTVQVIMLPRKTDEPEIGSLVKLRDKLFLFEPDINFRSTLPQHLYFISNEEIKEGDWFIMNGCILRQCKINALSSVVCTLNGTHSAGVCKKLVATTDKSLNLPLIPQSFIEEYVKKNGEIKDIDWNYYNEGNFSWAYNGKPQTVEEAAETYQKEQTYGFGNDSRVEDMSMDELRLYITSGFIAGANWQKQQNA